MQKLRPPACRRKPKGSQKELKGIPTKKTVAYARTFQSPLVVPRVIVANARSTQAADCR